MIPARDKQPVEDSVQSNPNQIVVTAAGDLDLEYGVWDFASRDSRNVQRFIRS